MLAIQNEPSVRRGRFACLLHGFVNYKTGIKVPFRQTADGDCIHQSEHNRQGLLQPSHGSCMHRARRSNCPEVDVSMWKAPSERLRKVEEL
jgi:hypothetical protein